MKLYKLPIVLYEPSRRTQSTSTWQKCLPFQGVGSGEIL